MLRMIIKLDSPFEFEKAKTSSNLNDSKVVFRNPTFSHHCLVCHIKAGGEFNEHFTQKQLAFQIYLL